MRKLIYIPIIHTEVDMGSLNEEIKRQYLEKYGESKWKEHARAIEKIWEGLRKRIEAMKLDAKKVRIYQDGLPLCGQEEKIVRELAAQKSPNRELILWLMEQGATLEGTENPETLREEYEMLKNIQKASDLKEKREAFLFYEQNAQKLLKKRDEFMAQRIEETLKKREIGILFIGLMHRVDEVLRANISVSYLIFHLPFKRNFEMKKIYG